MLLGTYLEPLRSHPCIEGALLPQNHTTFQVRGLRIISTRSHFLSSTFVPYPWNYIRSHRIFHSWRIPLSKWCQFVASVNQPQQHSSAPRWNTWHGPRRATWPTSPARRAPRGSSRAIPSNTWAAGSSGALGVRRRWGFGGEKYAEECGYMWFETCSNIPKRWKQDETGKLRCRCRNLFVNQPFFWHCLRGCYSGLGLGKLGNCGVWKRT